MWHAKSLVVMVVACLVRVAVAADAAGDVSRPNVVVILVDDLGYNDLSCYGAPAIRTPRIDRMAAEGVRFTDFYAPAAVCTPSRAGLLTGCYPVRVSMALIPPEPGQNPPRTRDVLYANSVWGLNPSEVTLAEVLKGRGYATQMVGKWHLGDKPEFSPLAQGFEHWLGTPYSNDMKPDVLVRDGRVVQQPLEQEGLIEAYTEEAVGFIKGAKEKPFFLYLAHNAPHTPLHVSGRFKGKSARGLYGDVVEAVDWSVGRVLDAIKEAGVDERTLVIFTSDNGPWLVRGENGGSATPLRSGKKTGYEGGMRVPCVLRWPGRAPAGAVCREVTSSIDFLPTIAGLAGAALDPSRKIDGKDVSGLWLGREGAKSPHEYFLYYDRNRLMAVRSGKWKYKVRTTLMEDYGYGKLEQPNAAVPAALYNLEWDPGEQKDVSKDHADVVKRLEGYLEEARKELGDERTGVKGAGVREIGRVGAAASPSP